MWAGRKKVKKNPCEHARVIGTPEYRIDILCYWKFLFPIYIDVVNWARENEMRFRKRKLGFLLLGYNNNYYCTSEVKLVQKQSQFFLYVRIYITYIVYRSFSGIYSSSSTWVWDLFMAFPIFAKLIQMTVYISTYHFIKKNSTFSKRLPNLLWSLCLSILRTFVSKQIKVQCFSKKLFFASLWNKTRVL